MWSLDHETVYDNLTQMVARPHKPLVVDDGAARRHNKALHLCMNDGWALAGNLKAAIAHGKVLQPRKGDGKAV